MSEDEKLQRVLEARRKLRARFLDRMARTPSLADGAPGGSGPANRHGMPKLPPDQVETKKWPVLDLGRKPEITLDRWRLQVDGAVEEPMLLDWKAFLALPQVRDVSDFHCVTQWSRMDMEWTGVQLATVAALVRPKPEATHLFVYGYDGYTTNLPLEEALKDDVLLAHSVDGQSLSRDHGGPVRMVVPQLYAWKGAKWVNRLEFLTRDRKGFWEQLGYSNSAHPWRNDRYASSRPALPDTGHDAMT